MKNGVKSKRARKRAKDDAQVQDKETMEQDDHYLKTELYELIRGTHAVFEFLQLGVLDGIWYWDLEEPEHEWMSARFWDVL